MFWDLKFLHVQTSKKNAFTLLMSSAKSMKLSDKISSDDKLMAPQRLCNWCYWRRMCVNNMYIEYSGFHANSFSQEDTHICFTHYNFAQYFQDIIYWTQPIKTSSFCGNKKFRFIFFIRNKIKKISLTIFVWQIRKTRKKFGVALLIYFTWTFSMYLLNLLKSKCPSGAPEFTLSF